MTEKASCQLFSIKKDMDKIVKLNCDLQSRLNGFIVELTKLSLRNKDLEEEKEALSQIVFGQREAELKATRARVLSAYEESKEFNEELLEYYVDGFEDF